MNVVGMVLVDRSTSMCINSVVYIDSHHVTLIHSL